MLFKFSDIITIDLNILGDCLPKVGVLDESQSVIGPENTKAWSVVAFETNIHGGQDGLHGIGL